MVLEVSGNYEGSRIGGIGWIIRLNMLYIDIEGYRRIPYRVSTFFR